MGYLACFVSGLVLGMILMSCMSSASIRDIEDLYRGKEDKDKKDE